MYIIKNQGLRTVAPVLTIVLPDISVRRMMDSFFVFFCFFFNSGKRFRWHSRYPSQVFHESIPKGLAVPTFNPVQGWTDPQCRIKWSPAEVWGAGDWLQLDTGCFSGQYPLTVLLFKLLRIFSCYLSLDFFGIMYFFVTLSIINRRSGFIEAPYDLNTWEDFWNWKAWRSTSVILTKAHRLSFLAPTHKDLK